MWYNEREDQLQRKHDWHDFQKYQLTMYSELYNVTMLFGKEYRSNLILLYVCAVFCHENNKSKEITNSEGRDSAFVDRQHGFPMLPLTTSSPREDERYDGENANAKTAQKETRL